MQSSDTDEIRIPIVEEHVTVSKRVVDTEHVRVQTFTDEEHVVVRDDVRRDHIMVTRVAVDREVTEAPPVRTEGDLTIVSVLEERLVIEKRLFVVEEIHLRRTAIAEAVELPTTLRRMRVEVTRNDLQHNLQDRDE